MTPSDVLVPIVGLAGMAFLIGFLFWPLVRDVLNRRRARAELPVLANEMGLGHQKGDIPGGMGTYRGSVDGHRIAIKPDETSVEIFLKGSLPTITMMVPYGWMQGLLAPLWRMMGASRAKDVEFSFGDGKLDRVFVIRQADRRVAEQLTSGPVREAIETLLDRHLSRLSRLTISSHSITCSAIVGSTKGVRSITPAQVRHLLPDMMDLARTLESTFETGE